MALAALIATIDSVGCEGINLAYKELFACTQLAFLIALTQLWCFRCWVSLAQTAVHYWKASEQPWCLSIFYPTIPCILSMENLNTNVIELCRAVKHIRQPSSSIFHPFADHDRPFPSSQPKWWPIYRRQSSWFLWNGSFEVEEWKVNHFFNTIPLQIVRCILFTSFLLSLELLFRYLLPLLSGLVTLICFFC